VPRRLVSIAAAPGWNARFVSGEGDEEEARTVTLISWALVEADDGTTEVVGVVQRSATAEKPGGWLGLADEVEGFQGYTFTGLTTQARIAEFRSD